MGPGVKVSRGFAGRIVDRMGHIEAMMRARIEMHVELDQRRGSPGDQRLQPRRLVRRFPSKHLVEPFAKDVGNAECGLERGRVFALLDGGNGLSRQVYPVSQIALRHLACQKAMEFDLIGHTLWRHSQNPRLRP